MPSTAQSGSTRRPSSPTRPRASATTSTSRFSPFLSHTRTLKLTHSLTHTHSLSHLHTLTARMAQSVCTYIRTLPLIYVYTAQVSVLSEEDMDGPRVGIGRGLFAYTAPYIFNVQPLPRQTA